MSAVETMSVQAMRERYLASLSPIELMEYELACARERRACAERREEERLTAQVLGRVDAASRTYRKGLRLSPTEVVLLAAELRCLQAQLRALKGGAA